MKKQKNLWKKKITILVFTLIALIAGFIFLNKTFTGNAILNEGQAMNLGIISLIGISLIACSIIMGIYFVKNK